jgi:hypothetical protein
MVVHCGTSTLPRAVEVLSRCSLYLAAIAMSSARHTTTVACADSCFTRLLVDHYFNINVNCEQMHLSSLNASQPATQLQFTSADSPAPLLPAPVPHSSSPPTSTAYVCLDTSKAYSVQYPASAPPGLKAALCGAVVTSDSSSNRSSNNSNSSSSDAAAAAAPAPLLVAVTADGCAPCAYVTVDVATAAYTAGSTAWVIAGPATAKGDAPSSASVCLPAGTYALTAPAAASATLCGQPLTSATAAAISAASSSATAAAVNQPGNSSSGSNSSTDNSSSDIESAAADSAAVSAAADTTTDRASVFYFNIDAAGSCAGCSPSAVTLQDSYGDGWSGSYITVAPLLVATQGPGAVLWRSTLAYGAASTESACLPQGYYVLDLDLSKGTFPDEMGWGFCGRSGDYKTSAFVFEVSAAGVCTWVRNISTERKTRVAPGDVGVGGDEPPPTCFSVAVVDVQGCFVEARSSRAAQPAVSVTFVERPSIDSSSSSTAVVSGTTVSLTPTASSTTVCVAQGSWGLSASASDSSENSSVCARSLQLSLCSAAAVKVGAPVAALTLALGTDNVCTVETKPGAVLTHTFSTTATADSGSGSSTQCSARVCTAAATSTAATTAFWSTQPCSAWAVAREHNAATTTTTDLSMHKLVTVHVGASNSGAMNTRAQYMTATAATTAAYSADRGGYSLTFEC